MANILPAILGVLILFNDPPKEDFINAYRSYILKSTHKKHKTFVKKQVDVLRKELQDYYATTGVNFNQADTIYMLRFISLEDITSSSNYVWNKFGLVYYETSFDASTKEIGVKRLKPPVEIAPKDHFWFTYSDSLKVLMESAKFDQMNALAEGNLGLDGVYCVGIRAKKSTKGYQFESISLPPADILPILKKQSVKVVE